VFDNVAYPLRVRRRPSADIRPRVLEALRLVAMQDYADRPAPALSGGQQFQAVLEQTRSAGLAQSRDGVVAGVSALAAPVFDDAGRMVLSLTVIGASGHLDLAETGNAARELRRVAHELSLQLGWRETGRKNQAR